MAGSPQYTTTLLDPCVANRASALEKIDVAASVNANRRAMISRRKREGAQQEAIV